MEMTTEMSVASRYQSHLAPLLACIAASTGPVLEIGVGHFSTPQLHAICGAMGRMLISTEPDAAWLTEFSRYNSGRHNFRADYTTLNVPGFVWNFGVVFIDHSPGGENRARAFRYFIATAQFVVVHDYEQDNEEAIAPLLNGVNHVVCRDYLPPTLVASSVLEIPEILKQNYAHH